MPSERDELCETLDEFGISRRKQFCVLPNERDELCEKLGDAIKTQQGLEPCWTALAGPAGIFYRDVKNKKPAQGRFNGGRRRIRTSDRSVRSRVLYPAELCVQSNLYIIQQRSFQMADTGGFEPPTARFVAEYSIQLSYASI